MLPVPVHVGPKTSGAPLNSNWYQLVAPQLWTSANCSTADKHETHHCPVPLKTSRNTPKDQIPISEWMEDRNGRKKGREQNGGANTVLFFLTTCSLWNWSHPPVCVSLCPPSPSLQPSLSPHRQGRSFSVSAHTPLGQHHLESTDTELIERAEGSSFLERR